MLTSRTSLLTAAGLLTSFLATAQTAEPMSPANQDMLSWMLRVLLGAVVLVAALASIALATAAANRKTVAQRPAPRSLPTAAAAGATAATPAPAVVAPAAPAAANPTPKAALAQEFALSE